VGNQLCAFPAVAQVLSNRNFVFNLLCETSPHHFTWRFCLFGGFFDKGPRTNLRCTFPHPPGAKVSPEALLRTVWFLLGDRRVASPSLSPVLVLKFVFRPFNLIPLQQRLFVDTGKFPPPPPPKIPFPPIHSHPPIIDSDGLLSPPRESMTFS